MPVIKRFIDVLPTMQEIYKKKIKEKRDKKAEELRTLMREYGSIEGVAVWLKRHPEEKEHILRLFEEDADKEGLSDEEKKRLKVIADALLAQLDLIAEEAEDKRSGGG